MFRWGRRRSARAVDVASLLATESSVVECWDEVQPASTVLGGAEFSGRSCLLRVLLCIREEEVAGFLERLSGDGYQAAPARPSDPAIPDGLVAVAVARALDVSAQTVAQELAVLQSMTARAGGTFVGWAVLATLAE